MITLEQAVFLATKAHEGQWRRPITVKSDDWDCYKLQTEFIHSNGNKVIWCNSDTFLVYEPYITHPLAVMNMMDTDEEKIVAILHDVIENTDATLHSDHIFGPKWIEFKEAKYELSSNLWNALYSLTKLNDDWDKFKEKGCYQSYASYIYTISLNKLATKVKIADIVHNLSCTPSDHAKQKYLKAIPVLLKSL